MSWYQPFPERSLALIRSEAPNVSALIIDVGGGASHLVDQLLALGYSDLGVGGAFLLIPAMIYLLRMPTSVAIGTSQFQIFFVAAATTILHAVVNQSVDIMLALLLIVGSVIGVPFGVRIGTRLKGEETRAILALLIMLIALRLFIGLMVTPSDIYSVVTGTP